MVNLTPPPRFTSKKTPVPFEWETEWTADTVWKLRRRDKFIVTIGFRTLGRPARSLIAIPTALRYSAWFDLGVDGRKKSKQL